MKRTREHEIYHRYALTRRDVVRLMQAKYGKTTIVDGAQVLAIAYGGQADNIVNLEDDGGAELVVQWTDTDAD